MLTYPYSFYNVCNLSPVNRQCYNSLILESYSMWSSRIRQILEDTCLSTYPKSATKVVFSRCWEKRSCIVSARVSRVWLEVYTLNVHLVCRELLIHTPFHHIDQCREMLGLVFSNRSTYGYYSTTEPSMPSWFATSQEKDRMVWEISIYKYLLWFLPSCMSLIHILPNAKDTH